MVQPNPTRVDYLAKFEELIEAYNSGSRNIDDLFHDLLALTRALTDEQQRHVREQLSEEELTVFDLLTIGGISGLRVRLVRRARNITPTLRHGSPGSRRQLGDGD
jgi:hypothetical protein